MYISHTPSIMQSWKNVKIYIFTIQHCTCIAVLQASFFSFSFSQLCDLFPSNVACKFLAEPPNMVERVIRLCPKHCRPAVAGYKRQWEKGKMQLPARTEERNNAGTLRLYSMTFPASQHFHGKITNLHKT